MQTQENRSGLLSFNDFLKKHSSEAKEKKLSESYFHADVVCEAWDSGVAFGKKENIQATKERILIRQYEKFVEKANKVYLFTKSFSDFLSFSGYKPERFFINIFHVNPKVIVLVNKDAIIDDDFVVLAYTKMNEFQDSFRTLFGSTLDISLMDDDGIIDDLLISDGFNYSEKII
jgi:hypothetical protein